MHRLRRPLWSSLLIVAVVASPILAQQPTTSGNDSQAEANLKSIMDDLKLDLSEQPLNAEEQQVADLISQRVSSTEWIGALGPVALSPFFGLTCLSGIAILGEDHLEPDHFLRRVSTPLRNPLVFLALLALTVLTSIPKFSKVSKPFAQACDQLETYSALVILLVIRFMGNIDLGTGTEEQLVLVHQAGVIEFSAEALLMLATIVNVIVINTVKFLFEVLIWITPIPFVDAIFEASNKGTCALLALTYAYSPMAATVINLLLFVVCLFVFRWAKRREVYYRSILVDFFRHWLGYGRTSAPYNVFPQAKVGKVPALARCELRSDADGWTLRMPRMIGPAIEFSLAGPAEAIESGPLMNHFRLDGVQFSFGKRNLADFAKGCNLRQSNAGPDDLGNLAPEMV